MLIRADGERQPAVVSLHYLLKEVFRRGNVTFYRRLVRRKGQKRAPVAVGHSILVIAYHILQQRAGHRELGGDCFDRQHTERIQRNLIRRLEKLGLKVTVKPLGEAA